MQKAQAMKMKIKKNDSVIVLSGKDKGKTGMVKQVLPKENRVVVVGVNMATHHVKPSQKNPQGGRVRREASIHASNVAHVDPRDNKATRVAVKKLEDGKKIRVAKRSGETIE